MPSLIKNLLHPCSSSSSKKNPYAKQDHPNNPTNVTWLSTGAPQSKSTNAAIDRSAGVSNGRRVDERDEDLGETDLLAEARRVVGRDPVTGKRGNAERKSAKRRKGSEQESNARSVDARATNKNPFKNPKAADLSSSCEQAATGQPGGTQEMVPRSGTEIQTQHDYVARKIRERRMVQDSWQEPTDEYFAPRSQTRVGDF